MNAPNLLNASSLAPLPATDLSRLAAGFDDPVHHAQATFRLLLDGLSRPGRVQTLPAVIAQTLGRPAGCSIAAAATLLTLLDSETRLWWAPHDEHPAGQPPVHHDGLAWCRFHTGARAAAEPALADFVLARAAAVDPALWSQLRLGSDEAPHSAATLIIEVDGLAALPPEGPADALADASGSAPGLRLSLTGPGIEHRHRLVVAGLSAAIWQARIAQQRNDPCGVDLLLCCADRLVGIPRSTRITLEG